MRDERQRSRRGGGIRPRFRCPCGACADERAAGSHAAATFHRPQRHGDWQAEGIAARRPLDYVAPRFVGVSNMVRRALGRSQVVRQRILIPPFGGSNPPAPANLPFGFQGRETGPLLTGERPRFRGFLRPSFGPAHAETKTRADCGCGGRFISVRDFSGGRSRFVPGSQPRSKPRYARWASQSWGKSLERPVSRFAPRPRGWRPARMSRMISGER